MTARLVADLENERRSSLSRVRGCWQPVPRPFGSADRTSRDDGWTRDSRQTAVVARSCCMSSSGGIAAGLSAQVAEAGEVGLAGVRGPA